MIDTNDTDATGPLDGLLVVEAGTMISAGTTGRLLADFGATVVKVEHPETGDHLRHFGPQADGTGLWWKYLGRNKQSVTLDVSGPDGRTVFEDLVSEADVLLENFRPGTLEKWGLAPESLRERNEDLVVLRISGFGQDGPYSSRPGFGTLAESMSGFAYLNGFEDRPPLLPPTGLADSVAAMFSTFAVMFALWEREVNGGTGQVIDTSLVEPIFSILGPQPLRYDQLDEVEERAGNRSTSSAPRNVYETGDGRYVAISASTQPTAIRVFEAIDRPDLTDDPRFADNESRLENVEELDAIIQDWMDERSREEVLDVFEETGATVAPIYNVADIVEDEHYQARDALVDVPDDELGSGTVQNVVPKFSDTPGEVTHLGPRKGEHNDAVYGGLLGYDDETLDDLRAAEVI
ncbi:CoA transferase [Salarchaeum sp. III]|uniref:CaiB/BaiF CoA transferase family protein n=1 Tax=Salarchaeum sp. III TaxID=3107927 RepID=UPI002ED90D1F